MQVRAFYRRAEASSWEDSRSGIAKVNEETGQKEVRGAKSCVEATESACVAGLGGKANLSTAIVASSPRQVTGHDHPASEEGAHKDAKRELWGHGQDSNFEP